MKAQVHAGGRGKAGGVKVVKSAEEAAEYANQLIGTRLVTYQTDANGQPVKVRPKMCFEPETVTHTRRVPIDPVSETNKRDGLVAKIRETLAAEDATATSA